MCQLRGLLLGFVVAVVAITSRAEIIDGIAAVVDGKPITLSDVERLATLEIVRPLPSESRQQYRRRVLDRVVDLTLQRNDASRFGLPSISEDAIAAELDERFPTPTSRNGFAARLQEAGATEEQVREVIRQKLEVDAYVEERFAPLIFVPLDEIERYYESAWIPRRRESGLVVLPLFEVREDIRNVLRAERLEREVGLWTEQLRSRSNVDVYGYR